MLIALWAVLGLLVGRLAAGFAATLIDRQRYGPATDASVRPSGESAPAVLEGVVAADGHALIVMSRRSLWPAELTGRCHNCGEAVGLAAAGLDPIHPREVCDRCGSILREAWPLAEIAAGLSFALLAWTFGLGWPLALYSAFAALLVFISLVDLRVRLILDVVTFPAMAAALAVSFFTIGPTSSLGGGLVAGVALLLIYLASVLIYRRGDAFGLGDVKLGLLIGLIVGSGAALTAILYGILVGGVVGLVVLAIMRDRKMAVPYGPSLAIGALIAILTSPAVWR